jgi:hypothetical protein
MSVGQHLSDGQAPSTPSEKIQHAPSISVPLSGVPLLKADPALELQEYHASFADTHNSYVSEMIALADTKGAWAFALTSGVLAYVLGDAAVQQILSTPTWSPKFALVATCIFLLVGSAGAAFLTIAPRLSSPSGEGIVFFGAVARNADSSHYVDAVARTNARGITEAKLKHSYDISRICSRKYDYLRRAIWLGMLGLVNALLVMLWLVR